MRLVHVVPHLDEEAAGPTQSVMRLSESIAALGHCVELHTMAAGRSPIGVKLSVHKEWRLPPRFGFSPSLLSELKEAAKRADVLHNHSLWSYPNMAAGFASGGAARLVTSPRGTLAPAARQRSRLRKMFFGPIQQSAIIKAACLHATSEMELRDIRDCGLRQPIILLPNGIDVPPLHEYARPTSGRRRLLFLGRIHPIKGIEMLLHAWQALQVQHPDWELVIAGKGDAEYVTSLRQMGERLDLLRVTFHGAIYGDAKSALFSSSEIFVLPTHTENFGMAVAEALSLAVPVITTRGAPWSGLESTESGWWIERDLEALVDCLDAAMQRTPTQLERMGLNGRTWMIRDFGWPAIAAAMVDSYRWLTTGGEKPACIHLD